MPVTLIGIDVSSKKLDVCLERPDEAPEAFELSNDAKGHKELIRRIKRRRARVVLEASSIYHLGLALALHAAQRIEVMVANPRAARDFARAVMQRSKTDACDAAALLEFARRMEFQAWVPPTPEKLVLRALTRRIDNLTKSRTQEKNRLHASAPLCEAVQQDIRVNIGHLGRRVQVLRKKALAHVKKFPELHEQLTRLTSIRGVGSASAIQILGEICFLPNDMTPRQWVAFAGLDPRIFQSGLSLNAPARISKMGNRALRAALFMPALVAVRWEPQVKAFYEKMVDRQKVRMQAIVAVMRKLLHAIHGMLRTGTDFDGKKFYAGG